MLVLALGSLFVFVVVARQTRRLINILFTFFIVAMIFWASGSLFSRIAAEVTNSPDLIEVGIIFLEFGFAGASLSVFVLAATLTDNRTNTFQSIVGIGVIQLVDLCVNSHFT